jgi:hypothetical protein
LNAQGPTASALYSGNGAQALRITVELKRDGAVRLVAPQAEFRNGDQIRLHFTSNFDGYVYALNETPGGMTQVIFPTAETGTSNQVRRAQEYTIPATRGWFRMTAPAGVERVLMIVSPTSVPELETKLRAPDGGAVTMPAGSGGTGAAVVAVSGGTGKVAAGGGGSSSGGGVATLPGGSGGATNSTGPVGGPAGGAARTGAMATGGVTNSTAKDSGKPGKTDNPLTKTNKEVSKVRSGISTVTNVTSLPRDVSRIPGLGSRDLVFEDDLRQGASFVSSKADGLSGPAIFSIALLHR